MREHRNQAARPLQLENVANPARDRLTPRLWRRRVYQPDAPPLLCELVRVVRHLSPHGLTLAELQALPVEFQRLLIRELPTKHLVGEKTVRRYQRSRIRRAMRRNSPRPKGPRPKVCQFALIGPDDPPTPAEVEAEAERRRKRRKRRRARNRRMKRVRAGWDGRCAYCHRPLRPDRITHDHVVPRSRGGRWSVENIRLCCPECNQAKADRTPQEWAADVLAAAG